jgi:hypothetical protein
MRLPSQLKLYLEWSAVKKREYGSVTNFLLTNRLYWQPIPSSDPSSPPSFSYRNPIPFADRSDYRILVNDWPYAVARGIKHLCVWLKVRLPVTEETGDLSDTGREMIEKFVDKTFTQALNVQGQDRVMWFKNWAALQSVRGVEHIHVLLRDVDEEKLGAIIEKPGW